MITFIVISLLFIAAYAVAILYFLLHWKETEMRITKSERVVSVIIPVRNEANNIERILNDLQRQSYPASLFEVIVIDDHSDDGTLNVINGFIRKSGMEVLLAASSGIGKKAAIETGVKLAKGDLLLTTDGDCAIPHHWIACHAARVADMVMGPVKLTTAENFVSRFQQLDYMALQVIGLASAATPFPLMCSGANLSITKSAFQKAGGYQGNREIASGDDTFLMLSMKDLEFRISAEINKEVTVTAAPAPDLAALLNQRRRWASKTKYYRLNYIKYFGIVVIAANLMFAASILLLFVCQSWWLSGGILLKVAVDIAVLRKGGKFFEVKPSPSLFILSEFFYPVFIALILLPFKTTWKKRLL